MKISIITGEGVDAKTFVLADSDKGICHTGLRITGRRVTQITRPLRAAKIRARNRGNAEKVVTFEVARLHKTPKDAEQYLLEHADSVPGDGRVVFEAVGRVKRLMENAVIDTVDSRYHGATTWHTYQIIGGLIEKPPQPNL